MPIKQKIQQLLRARGIELFRYNPTNQLLPLIIEAVKYEPDSHPFARRMELLQQLQIDVVLDVGANEGQFGKHLRRFGYQGRLISFEPLSSAYRKLVQNISSDDKWEAFNHALGSSNTTVALNISNNPQSSSVLEMLPAHLQVAPTSNYIGKETVEMKTLETSWETIRRRGRHFYLKIDTQGFEKEVIDGAKSILPFINAIQVEMSLTPLYQGELLFPAMYERLYEEGYRLTAIEPGLYDSRANVLLQVDGIFRRIS